MFCVFFTSDSVADLADVRKSDRELFAKYFGAMLDRGVYLAPSPFEANFLSAAHTARDVDGTIAAADAALTALLASV
jgi:glutamate-1-semialdehyde 2,1-aminomutase